MNNYVDQYNHPDTLLVFSSYAFVDKAVQEQNALAWYTKELLTAFPQKKQIVVISEKTQSISHNPIKQKNVLVMPCWKKNDLRSVLDIFLYFSRFPKAKRVLFEFEFNMFGNITGPIVTLLLLFFLKLQGKKIFFHLHQVILDLTSVKRQVHIYNPLLLRFFNICLRLFYILIGLFSQKVILTEIALSNKLTSYIDEKKILILPIGIISVKKLSKAQALKRVVPRFKKSFTILFFGYLSWYKGIDWLVKMMPSLQKKYPHIRLVVVGDKSPTLAKKPHYRRYYRTLKRLMEKNKNIIHTGYVNDEKAGLWFSASDLVILPYRTFMSSSGPLAWALSYGKPVVFSKQLMPYMQSQDFNKTMKAQHITPSEMFFELNEMSFISLIKTLPVRKLGRFSKQLGIKRSKQTIMDTLIKTIYGNESQPAGVLPYLLKYSYAK